MFVSRLVLFCRLFDRRSRTTSCFIFFWALRASTHVYTRSIFTFIFTYIMQIYAISINWHSFSCVSCSRPCQLFAVYFAVWSHFYCSQRKARWRWQIALLLEMAPKRAYTHTRAYSNWSLLLFFERSQRSLLTFFFFIGIFSLILYCCRLLIAVNCSAFAFTSLTGKDLFLFLFFFGL